jgi:hypothetical protein
VGEQLVHGDRGDVGREPVEVGAERLVEREPASCASRATAIAVNDFVIDARSKLVFVPLATSRASSAMPWDLVSTGLPWCATRTVPENSPAAARSATNWSKRPPGRRSRGGRRPASPAPLVPAVASRPAAATGAAPSRPRIDRRDGTVDTGVPLSG